MTNSKRELNEIYDRKGRAAMYRSKCRWVEKGECPTKYFFNLEKRNYNRKVISELETTTGEHITNETLILLEIDSYCNNLYSSETTATLNEYLQFTNSLEISQLIEDMRDRLEGPLTYEECKEALSSFSKDKSPGEDGFTEEFYSKFLEKT